MRGHPLAPARTRHCGRTRYQTEVELRTSGGEAWWQGVLQCRARVCPPCFLARRFRAALELERVVSERERETGQQSMLATLTIRHHLFDPVDIVKAVRAAWRDMLQSRAFREWRKHHGVAFVIAEEVTRGEHGWHPHLHALLMPALGINDGIPEPWADPDEHAQRSDYAFDWYEHWCHHVRRKLGAAYVPNREHGADLQPCDSAAYLTKLGLELADPAAVKGRSPLALLEDGQRDLYMQLQASRTRARDITYSRELAGIRADKPEPPESAELARVRGSDWGYLLSLGWEKPLEVAERAKDPETARAALSKALGKEYTLIEPPK